MSFRVGGYYPMILLAVALVSGCTTAAQRKSRVERIEKPGRVVSLADGSQVKKALLGQLEEWKSVRYRSGGLSRKGIDCSGLVYVTYLEKFGIRLPRSTKYQVRRGRRISWKKLRPGDLVFFKTGFFTRHVGIYVEDRGFLHVSRKRGVTLSRLDDSYWRKRYWQSRRIVG